MVGLSQERKHDLARIRRAITVLLRTALKEGGDEEAAEELSEEQRLIKIEYLELFETIEETPDPEYIRVFDEYEDKVTRIRELCKARLSGDRILRPVFSETYSEEENFHPATSSRKESIRKENMIHFDGSRADWPLFANSFKANVLSREKVNMDEARSILYLITSGPPNAIIKAGISQNKSLTDIWKSLEDQYEDKVFWQMEVRKKLQTFPSCDSFFDLEGMSQAIESVLELQALLLSMPEAAEAYNDIVISSIANKFYAPLSYKLNARCKNLEQVLTLLREKLSDSERNAHLAPSVMNSRSKCVPRKVNMINTVSIRNPKCYFCQSNDHFSDQCNNVEDDAKRRIIQSLRLCRSCLRPGHFAEQCQRRFTCEICAGQHKTNLHSLLLGNSGSSNSQRRDEPLNFPQHRHNESTTFSGRPTFQARSSTQNVPRHSTFTNPPPRVDAHSRNEPQSSAENIPTRAVACLKGDSVCVCKKYDKDPRPIGIIPCNGIDTEVLIDTGSTSTIVSGEFVKNLPKYPTRPVRLIPFCGASFTIVDSTVIVYVKCLDGGEMPVKAYVRSEVGDNELLIGADQINLLIGEIMETPIGTFKIGLEEGPDNTSNINICRIEAVEFDSDEEFDAEEAEMKVEIVDNKFVASLPLTAAEKPRNNFEAAVHLLDRSQARLKVLGLFEAYEQELLYYLVNHFAVEIQDASGYFMPHHAVIREEALSTKCRLVFNASHGKSSLNDALFKGHARGLLIFQKLLRFRSKRLVIVTDLQKAFLQIAIKEEDQPFLKFLWRTAEGNLRIFQFTALPFGLSASPSILIKCLETIIASMSSSSQRILENAIYMDDVILTADDELELMLCYEEAKEMFGKFNFNFHKCKSNLNSFAEERMDSNATTKVLGINWETASDRISLNLKPKTVIEESVSKRVVLSVLGSPFDPLGVIDPVKLVLKNMLSIKTSSMDEALPVDKRKEVVEFCNNIPLLQGLSTRRWCRGAVLIGFSDASKSAYGYCIYLWDSSSQFMSLLCGKSKVVPQSAIRTVPELELMALHTLMKAIQVIAAEMNISAVKVFSDSMINLHRLNRSANDFKAFTSSRIFSIQKLATCLTAEFYHTPTESNPADVFSRFIDIKDFVKIAPSLYERMVPNLSNSIKFVKVYSIKREPAVPKWAGFEHLIAGDLMSTVHRTKVLLKAARLFKDKRNVRKPSFFDAWKLLIRFQQDTHDSSHLNCQTFWANDLLHVASKIPGLNLIWIPKQSPLAKQIIVYHHMLCMHGGVERTIGEVSQYYFIPTLRKLTKTIVNQCRLCTIERKKAIEQPPGLWPKERCNFARAFENVSIDHFGPIFLRSNSKHWGLIVVCLATRAIKIEIVASLSSSATLLALETCFALIGRPKVIFSDNGTGFVRLAKDLATLKANTEAATEGIRWKFSPPLAPWCNSASERLIGCIKTAMKAIDRKFNSNMELRAFFIQIEAIINNRVLFYDDKGPVTPMMLWQHRTFRSLFEEDLILLHPLQLWKKLQHERERFQEAWWKLYRNIHAIQPRSKGASMLSPGDIVLIPDKDAKRKDWVKAVIEKIYPSSDNIPRVVQLKTSQGSYKRPVNGLVMLEVRSPVATSDSL